MILTPRMVSPEVEATRDLLVAAILAVSLFGVGYVSWLHAS